MRFQVRVPARLHPLVIRLGEFGVYVALVGSALGTVAAVGAVVWFFAL